MQCTQGKRLIPTNTNGRSSSDWSNQKESGFFGKDFDGGGGGGGGG